MAESFYGADQLNELTKEVYADGIKEIVPSATKLVNLIKFNEQKKLGQEYKHPILLTLENGFTYDASGNMATLNPAQAANVKQATITGTEMILRSATSVKNITSQSTDNNSFKRHIAFLTGNMLKSMYHRLEIQLMYGQAGLGIVDSVSSADLVMEAAEWAPAIWNGSEGALIDIYSSVGALRGTAKIVSVDPENYTISLEAAVPGVASTDVLYWKGARGNEFKGLHAIATTSGSLFGIDNTQYNLFKSNLYNVGANAANPAILTFQDVQLGVAQAMTKGFGEDEMTLIINPKVWANLLTEQAALRRYDSSHKASVSENGSQEIVFQSQNGKITIVASNFCKEGYAYGFSPKDMMRVGSSDVSFKDPVTGEDKYFRTLENAHGVEMRAYCDQALFSTAPARIVLFRHIKAEKVTP